MKTKHDRVIVYGGAILVSGILIFEEFRPFWGASTQYDFYDIIASIIGACFSVFTFEILKKRRLKSQD